MHDKRGFLLCWEGECGGGGCKLRNLSASFSPERFCCDDHSILEGEQRNKFALDLHTEKQETVWSDPQACRVFADSFSGRARRSGLLMESCTCRRAGAGAPPPPLPQADPPWPGTWWMVGGDRPLRWQSVLVICLTIPCFRPEMCFLCCDRNYRASTMRTGRE